MIIRNVIGICFFLTLAVTGHPGIAQALDIYKSSTSSLTIPNDGSAGFSGISIWDTAIPANAVVTSIDVGFYSENVQSKDLEVCLSKSSFQSQFYIWNHEGGTAPNPSKTVNNITQFNGLNVKGSWSLSAKNTATGGTGKINSWWIKVYYTSASGSGTTTYNVTGSFLNNLTFGHDENGDGYMEDYEFPIQYDIVAPSGVRVYPKIICNTTGQAWKTGTSDLNNAHNVVLWNHTYFWDYVKSNSTLDFTIQIWDDSSCSKTLLASSAIGGSPIKVGVGYFPDGYVSDWVPGSDIDADRHYDTYQFNVNVEGITHAGPAVVYAKIICTTTGQTWWASAPWTITNESGYHTFDFSAPDFAGYLSADTNLDFVVELWDVTKTTKLGSTSSYNQINSGGVLTVEASPCSVSVNNFAATNIKLDPNAGGNTTFNAEIAATPAATWRLNINNEEIASGITSTVSQSWNGKDLAGHALAPGTYTATLTATGGQCTDSKSVSVTIGPLFTPLSITTASALLNGTVSIPYSQTLLATGGQGTYSWSLSSGSLPAGLTLNPSGIINGTPEKGGTYSFIAEVSDSEVPTPATTSQPFTLDVVYLPLVLSTAALSDGKFGTDYNQSITATGGNAPYTWSIIDGSLPAGLSLDVTSGVISGVPIDVGNFSLSIQVTDAQSTPATSSVSYTFNITNSLSQRSAEYPTVLGYETSPNICIGSTSNVVMGFLTHNQELFSTKGAAAFDTAIELFYRSLPTYNGPLGNGWSHSFNIFLTVNSDGSIVLQDGSGGKSFYTKAGSSYISPPGDFSTLVKKADGTYVISYRDGHSYNFDSTGKIMSMVDRFTNTLSFTYTNGDLTGITDPAQRTTSIVYDLAATPHRISFITDPNGKTYDFAYQGSNLYRVTNPVADPAVSQIRGYWEYQYYPDSKLLKSKRDPNNNITQYTYYADQRMWTSIDPEGVVDPSGHTRTLVYPTNTDNLRTTILTEKDGGRWQYTFDALAGVIKAKTDPNGKVINYYYYPNGSLKAKTEPKDDTVRLTTFYSYDNYGSLVIETEPADLSSYNPVIDPETVTDPAALSLKSPPIKAAKHFTYDNANFDRITSVSDERGTTTLTTSFVYTTDQVGEVVTATTMPGNFVTVTKKYPNGTVREIIDPNQKSTSFTYYPTAGTLGLLQSSTDTAGIKTTITGYDKNGNPTTVKVSDKNNVDIPVNTTMVYDALSRLTSATVSSNKTTPAFPNIITTYGYDQGANLTSLLDAENHLTSFQYNYNGQVTRSTDAKLNDTVFTYSGSGCGSCGAGVDKVIGVYDAKVAKKIPLESQPHTAYQYDQLGRLQYETDPLGKKMYYTYYDNGQLWQKFDATNATPGTLLVSYLYNNRGQITDKNFTDGTAEHYTYTANGQLETATNHNISYTYVYYDNGRLHTVTDTTNNRVISYDQYDGLGQRKQLTILKGAGADERVITYDYDSANRPWYIISNAGTFTYAYDTLGRRDTLTYPNNTLADWDFDDLNRLTAISHKTVGGPSFAAFTYDAYDKIGNRKSVAGNKNEGYFYDEVYRLLSVTSVKSETFGYDGVGNRQRGPNPVETDYAHNDANQMTKGRKLGYDYDNFGNQKARTIPGVTDKSWIQSWDYENKLVKVEKIKGPEKRTVNYTYDPLGRRIGKQMTIVKDGVSQTQSWSYVYDGDSIAVEIYTDENYTTTKTFYTQGPTVDEHLAMERGGQFYCYHADGLGNVAAITDASRAVVQSYEYDSYGMVTPSVDFRNSYTYTGREWDKETGLYYYRARYYDPMEGRFISKDPIQFAGGINLYTYVRNSPINYTDPTGLFWFRQDWQTDFVVGRERSLVEPGGGISQVIEDHVPAGRTFGDLHDAFVDFAAPEGSAAWRDWLFNFPSMIPMYPIALGTEVLRTLGVIDQPKPAKGLTPCKSTH